MNQAIVIGVSHYNNFSDLDSEAGAESFARWLTKQNYQTIVITDANNTPVTPSRIRNRIRELVVAGTTSKLVVYFTGHGMLNGTNELWLLNDVDQDPSAAVNLAKNIELARYCGIPNVMFISDACRSTPDSLSLSTVDGSSVFPSPQEVTRLGRVDRWFATLPGSVALELPVKDSTAIFSSAYTEVFVKAHSSGPEKITREHTENGETFRVVDSHELDEYLEKALPRHLLKQRIRINQQPSAIIESRKDTYLGRYMGSGAFSESPQGLGDGESASASIVVQEASQNAIRDDRGSLSPTPELIHGTRVELFESVGGLLGGVSRGSRGGLGGLLGGGGHGPVASEVSHQNRVLLDSVLAGRDKSADTPAVWSTNEDEQASERLRDALLATFSLNGRGSFETGTGFSVFGAEIVDVFGHPNDIEVVSDARTDIRVYPEASAATMLLRFADGSGTALPYIKGYIGSITVGDYGVSNVNYQAVDVPLSDSVRRMRASIAAASNMGVFTVTEEDASHLADRIRFGKGVDPTLGVYAAYAYHQVGLIDQIDSVRNLMEVKLLDIELLARTPLDPTTDATLGNLVPYSPLLSQGWDLLDVKNIELPAPVLAAGNHRKAGVWTTFEPEGMEILIQAHKDGEIQ